MENNRSVRVATYNIHKCKGLDQRIRPARIVEVLQEIDADVIALQEVVRYDRKGKEWDQARFIAEELGFHYEFGEVRRLKGAPYGNVVLARFPLDVRKYYDLTAPRREARGGMRVDIKLDTSTLHVFNLHLGTKYFERRHQARRLHTERILHHENLTGMRIVMGDFNEWSRGSTSRMLSSMLESADIREHLHRSRTYPGVMPIFHLDHIYFDPGLRLDKLTLHRSRKALMASDHLPLVGEFILQPSALLN